MKELAIMILSLAFLLAVAACLPFATAAPMGEVALFTEQAGWMGQPTAVKEGEEMIDMLKTPTDVVVLTDKQIGDWAEEPYR